MILPVSQAGHFLEVLCSENLQRGVLPMEGSRVGWDVGANDNDLVGESVGVNGLSVGTNDGTCGESVGFAVGTFDGFSVGSKVGSKLGAHNIPAPLFFFCHLFLQLISRDSSISAGN